MHKPFKIFTTKFKKNNYVNLCKVSTKVVSDFCTNKGCWEISFQPKLEYFEWKHSIGDCDGTPFPTAGAAFESSYDVRNMLLIRRTWTESELPCWCMSWDQFSQIAQLAYSHCLELKTAILWRILASIGNQCNSEYSDVMCSYLLSSFTTRD